MALINTDKEASEDKEALEAAMEELDLGVQGRRAAYTIPEVILTEPRKPSPYI